VHVGAHELGEIINGEAGSGSSGPASGGQFRWWRFCDNNGIVGYRGLLTGLLLLNLGHETGSDSDDRFDVRRDSSV
jgi:hypothetical protein